MAYDDVYERIVARNYDAAYAVIRDPSGDVAFYVGLARESGGPVLELGCGTGRILLPTARAGIACVGVDSSPAMLAVLRDKQPPPHVQLVQATMQTFDLGDRQFPLITAPFRVLSHLLTVGDQLAALARVRRHLAPGGTFALDLFDPKLDRIGVLDEPEHLAARFPDAGVEIRRWDTVTRDPTRQVMTLRLRFEGGPPELTGVAAVQMRWYYRFELEHLLARAGFSDLAFYGGFDRRPWAAGGETIVLARA